ncbi:hypothetical protein AVEN_229729-1 [Araneus ventricosus]|uniref:F-box domain-containing protein n=1 Tax=Araneus ventricosus TaxID=182803 RepID=A0A4Y2V157_ARAVE|nr:hypothetical protein AVEN_229729-1 [Araneus ventricosus]
MVRFHLDNLKEETCHGNERTAQIQQGWGELPEPAIEKIFSYLNRRDQNAMSKVCTRWASEYNAPGLWKNFIFYLPEQSRYTEGVCPAVSTARRNAEMFRHVEIICKTRNPFLNKTRVQQLKLFLMALERAPQIIKIKVVGLGKLFSYLSSTLRLEILDNMSRFFRSINTVQEVILCEINISKYEAIQILNSIFHSDNNKIKYVTIRKVVEELEVPSLNGLYEQNINIFSENILTITSIEFDYSKLFEDLLNSLYQKIESGNFHFDKKQHKLKNLKIYHEDNRQFSGILPDTWNGIKTAFPQLNVNIKININNMERVFEHILVKNIPLRGLEMTFDKRSNIQGRQLINKLEDCNYENLEDLKINWFPSINIFAVRPLKQLLCTYTHLRRFHLVAECNSGLIENMILAFFEDHRNDLLEYSIYLKEKLYFESV